MNLDLLDAGDPAWDRCLAGVAHDVHHTAGYHRVAEASGAGLAHLFVVREGQRGFAWPYLLRRVASVEGMEGSDDTDVDSVYGYPGPLTWGLRSGDPFIGRAWHILVDTWRSQGAVAAFTRFNPLLDNAKPVGSLTGSETNRPVGADGVVFGGPTVSIDCTLSGDGARESYARVLRQEIAQGRRAGLATEHDPGWRELATFVRLYRQTMKRNQAPTSYDLSEAAARRLHDELGPRVHLLVTRREGIVVAAGLFTETNGMVHAHLVGTDASAARLSPLKVLLDDARAWAAERGDRMLHLGGGRGGREDSLFAFKRRFSPRRHQFFTGRWILDPARYRALTEQRRRAVQDRGSQSAEQSWFPAYRAPLASSSPRPAPVAGGG